MLSSFSLKLIALITMIIDHIGLVFFPQYIWIRYIGRLSFPIYAFLLATGFVYTHSRGKYALRLLAFALISEIPYDYGLYSGFSWSHQNIMFTLLCSLMILWSIENIFKSRNILIKVCSLLAVPVLIAASALCNFSYGVYGVMLPVFYYPFLVLNPLKKVSAFFEKRCPMAALSGAACTYIFNGIKRYSVKVFGCSIKLLSINSAQLYACCSSLPILLYNGKPGKYKLKWFFYLSYPVHISIIFLVKTFIIK